MGPAGYHRDHNNFESYLEHSAFLPYLNNEKYHAKTNMNKQRFESLNHLLMVKFMYDPIIYPMESAFFGEINSDGKEVPMEQTTIYQQNTFGLRTLNESGRIDRQVIDGVHLMFRNEHI